MKKINQQFYEEHTWGVQPIKESKDLPTLKFTHLQKMLLQNSKNKNLKLLEIGCGSGRILASIRKYHKNMQLFGIDISKEQIRSATQTHKSISFITGNAENLPYPSNSFDYVIIFDLLEHVEDPQKVLNEIHRVLKKNGTFHAVIPAENRMLSPYWISKKIFKRHFKEKTGGHIQQFTFKQIEQMFRKAKLKPAQKKYSYHFLGSIMDYTMFTLLLNKKLAKIYWSNNKYYHANKQKKTFSSKILNGAITFANAIAYYESKLFSKTKLFSSVIHINAKK